MPITLSMTDSTARRALLGALALQCFVFAIGVFAPELINPHGEGASVPVALLVFVASFPAALLGSLVPLSWPTWVGWGVLALLNLPAWFLALLGAGKLWHRWASGRPLSG